MSPRWATILMIVSTVALAAVLYVVVSNLLGNQAPVRTTHEGLVLSVDCPQFGPAPSYAVMNENGTHFGYKISEKDVNCLLVRSYLGEQVIFIVEHEWDTGDWIIAIRGVGM